MANGERLAVASKDHEELQRWLRAGTTRQSLATRAKIVLLSSEGMSGAAIAMKLGVTRPTVYKWRSRYQELGLAGLRDHGRAGRPRKMTQAKAKEILRLTTERIPHEASHWSVRLMAEYAGVSTWQVRQVWKAADLRPHRLKTFKISNDPQFAEKVVDIVGLYMSPPTNAMVLSVDEKTQIQALNRTQPMLPLRPGQIERRTHDYTRHGTASLYAAMDITTGQVIGRVTQRHRAKEFIDFLRQVECAVPEHVDLHIILDNSSTHKTKQVEQFLAKRPRIVLHFTPTSASWLNAVEGWFGRLTRRALQRGAFTSVAALREELHRFIQSHNEHGAKPFVWTKSAESILASVKRVKDSQTPRTSRTGH
jgi:transposase